MARTVLTRSRTDKLALCYLKRLQQIQVMCLNLPVVGLVSAGKVRCGLRVVLHRPQHPIEDSLAESSAVGITQGTTMADRNVALP
jgi:hypothetical protein